jgi:AraC-like DNA-binding protein
VLKEHPDWSTESVANYCGFSSREYFHRTFRQMTGMTPANFQ